MSSLTQPTYIYIYIYIKIVFKSTQMSFNSMDAELMAIGERHFLTYVIIKIILKNIW